MSHARSGNLAEQSRIQHVAPCSRLMLTSMRGPPSSLRLLLLLLPPLPPVFAAPGFFDAGCFCEALPLLPEVEEKVMPPKVLSRRWEPVLLLFLGG